MTVVMRMRRPAEAIQPLDDSQCDASCCDATGRAVRLLGAAESRRPAVRSSITTATVEVRNTGASSLGPGYLWTARRTFLCWVKRWPSAR